MSSITTYVCDRCGKGISYLSRVVLRIDQVGDRKSGDATGWAVDLCHDCVSGIKQDIRFPK